jgi:ubiquinol-cytochrome c reductase iron-sulfur subunit
MSSEEKHTMTATMDNHQEGTSRRNFLYIGTGAFAAVGVGTVIWPFVDQMNPDASQKAMASIEVDIAPIEVGQAITVLWRGKPVFIRHRAQEEIDEAKKVDVSTLRDPQTDEQRAQKPEWLIMIGICTHLGCVPNGQKSGDVKGDFNGWFCPCHGSHYDTAGRIRKGPAPRNLDLPDYTYLTDTKVQIG